jgi:acyl-CoA synthetase (AMP-forming)/AMP-acid ligase II
VADAIAVGLPDPVDGERVGACVVASPGTTAADLRSHCAELLPPAAVPDRIDLVESLDRTVLGKPRRAARRRRMLTAARR